MLRCPCLEPRPGVRSRTGVHRRVARRGRLRGCFGSLSKARRDNMPSTSRLIKSRGCRSRGEEIWRRSGIASLQMSHQGEKQRSFPRSAGTTHHIQPVFFELDVEILQSEVRHGCFVEQKWCGFLAFIMVSQSARRPRQGSLEKIQSTRSRQNTCYQQPKDVGPG